jgi:hypothetical protein
VPQRHDVTRVVDPAGAPSVVQDHKREQPESLGLVGHQPGEGAGQADRFRAQLLAHEVAA